MWYKRVLTPDGMVVYDIDNVVTYRFTREEASAALMMDGYNFDWHDHHCEIVHMEISGQCQLNCDYCYVAKDKKELYTDAWKEIIDQVAAYGAFQITFGGGEPTLRPDVLELAEHAYIQKPLNKRLNVAMTTNGLELHQMPAPELRQLFRQINVSYHGDIHILSLALEFLRLSEVPRGVNLIIFEDTKREEVAAVATTCALYDAELVMLAGKIPGQIVQAKRMWHLGHWVRAAYSIRVGLDGLSCAGNVDEWCMQKKRFCDIDVEGNVLPCSFIREPIGKVPEQKFSEVWANRGDQVPCPYTKEA